MPINGKVKSIYDTLKGGGADVGTEQEFNDWFFAKGTQGYKNRKSVYDTLKGGGADAGANYEEFAGWLGLHAVKGGGNVVNKTKAASQSRTNGAASTPQQRAQDGQTDALGAMGAVAKWGQQLARDTKQRLTGNDKMTAEDRARMSAEVGGMMADVERAKQQTAKDYAQAQDVARNPWQFGSDKGPLQARPAQFGYYGSVNNKGEVQSLRDLTGGENVKAGISVHTDPATGEAYFVTENGEEYGAGEYQLAKLRQQELDRAKDEGAMMRHQVETLSDDVEEAYEREARAQEERYEAMEGKMNPFLRSIAQAGDPMLNNGNTAAMRYTSSQEMINLDAARSSLRTARQLIREADINARKGTLGDWAKRSFVGGLVRGFGDKFFDVSTWDFGMTDIKEGSALLTALNKADKKEPLTESEQALLDAKSIELAVTAQLATQIGRGYKAGQVTGEMAPFMLEMFINPAAKAGEAAVNKLVRYCLKRFPQKMMQKGWKGAVRRGAAAATARVAGDIAGSALMTATTGLGQVKAGQIQNQIGDIKYEMDQHGNVHYSDRENEMTPEDAWKKSFKEQWKERGSEMIGGYFAPIFGTMGKITAKMLTSKAGQKVGGKALMDWINSMSANRFVTGMRGFLDRTQWHGVGGEYFEEKAGDVLDALFIGNVNFNLRGEDGKLFTAENSFWNLDDNIDTLLGVSVFGGLMSAINSAGFGYDVYRARKSMRLSGAAGRTAFGSERSKDWESFDARLQSDDLDAVKEMLQEMLTSNDYTDAQRNAIVTHAKNVMSYRGYVMGEAKKEEAGVWDADKEADQQMWDDGYKLEDAEEIYNSRAARDAAADDFAMYFGEEAATRFAEDPGASLTQILEDENISEGAKNVARIYNSAAQRYNGVLARINDEIDERVTESDVSVDNVTDAGGNVRRATLTETDEAGEPKQVYIVSGEVVMRETGDGRRVVDQEASDKSIFVKDTPDGKPRQVDISEIASAEEPVAADEAKAEAAQQIETEVANREGDKLDFGMSFEDGQTYEVEWNGQKSQVTVVRDNGDGTVEISIDGAEPMAASKEQVVEMVKPERAAAENGGGGAENGAAGGGLSNQSGRSNQGAQANGSTETEEPQSVEGSGTRFTLSNQKAANGERFYQDVNGNIDLVDIPQEVFDSIGYTKAPLRLTESMVRHILDHHGKELHISTADEAISFVKDVMEHFDHIRLGDNGSLVFSIENGRDKTGRRAITILLNSDSGDFYGVKTSGYEVMRKLAKRPLLWERGVNMVSSSDAVTEPVTSLDDPQDGGQSGNASGQSSSLSAGKDTENVSNAQGNGEKNDAMPMVEVKGKLKPDWSKATPARAHAYIYKERGLSRENADAFVENNRKAAASELEKLRRKRPEMGTDLDEFEEKTAEWQAKMDELQRRHDYWQAVKDEQRRVLEAEAMARAERDAVLHDEAVAAERADYEARKRAEAERRAVGNGNPMPAITEKWNNAAKVDGHRDEIMLPDGTSLKGHYVLHESGASSPSHNPETWQKTDGFPMDANGGSVNDRDYERDRDAQEHTQSIARQYDQRALQSVPVVSNDGVVLSGNGRTMAGELAARDNTDGAYVSYLREYAPKFGFTAEQVDGMQHPRVSFVPDEAMPYTAETFARFNQQEMKSQNKTEQAVKLGKTVGDGIFRRIVRAINGYDTLGDFYNDAEASLGAVYDLHSAGVIPQAQLAEMVDGVRGQEKLSAVGREFLENMLIGKAFESDPEVVRMLTAEPSMRRTVITALGEIVDNIALGGEWSLQGALADAVKLCFDARQGGARYGEIVSVFARQGVLFADPDELQTVADFNNATMLMLADVLNDKRVTLLKTTVQLYNDRARDAAAGQADLFAGGIESREDILRDVINFINENYGKRKEIEAARASAVERRKAESVQQDGTPPAVNSGSEENTNAGVEVRNNDGRGDNGRIAERQVSLSSSEEIDENGIPFVKAADGTTVFGEIREDSGLLPAPIRLSEGFQDEDGKGYGLAHIEANHGDQIRSAGFASVEEFVEFVAQNYDEDNIRVGKRRENGNTTYLIQVQDEHDNTLFIEMSSDGSYWNVNSAGIFRKGYSNKKETVAKTEPQQPNNAISTGSSLSADEVSGITSTEPNGEPTVSAGKDSEKSATVQGNGGKVSENQSPIQGLDGYTEDEVLSLVRGDIEEKLADAGIDGVTIKGMSLHGSRLRGDARGDSDLDVVVEYEGDMSEDGLFNILNDKPMEIEGIRVDVNPITKGKSGTLVQYLERSRQYDALAAAERETDTEPTEAQKEAGNYKKGHVKIDGYDVTIEQPKGSVRRGKDASGKRWEQEMHNTYGYIRGTEGVDGDHIDVFLSDDPSQGDVFVVDQVNEDGSFDEHKVMYGFPDIESARKAYLSNYEDGWQGLGAITQVSKDEFKKWIRSSHRKTKPFADYRSVKKEAGQNEGQPSKPTVKEGEDFVSAAANLQEPVDSLGALQGNGKSYDENAYDAYLAGRRFGNDVDEGVSVREAIDLAHKMVSENDARGGLYILPFLDGVGDGVDLRHGKHIEEAKKREAEYRSRKEAAGSGVAEAPQQAGPAEGGSTEASAEAPQEDGGARMKFTERAEGARDVELARRERMARAMAAEMEGIFGVPMRVITRPEDITNAQARRKVEEDRQKGTEDTKAWYDTATGEVCVYAPHVGNPRVAVRTYLHEVVGHKGLRGLFRTETDEDGRETNPGFDKLCDRVWEMMPEAQRKRFLNYPGVRNIADEQQRQRAAADEYMAHMAERDGEWDVDRSVKERVVHWLKMHLNKVMERLGFDATLTDDDVRQLIKASARRLERGKRKAMKGAAEETAEAEGGGAMFMSTEGDNSQAGGELLREGYSEPAPAVERRRLTPKEQRQRDAYEARRFRNLHTFVDKTLDKLRIKDICDVYDSIDDVPGAQDMPSRRQHARGWYNPETGRITIVLRNHRNQEDVGLTILHEAVGHHGLRELFGERFDTFLDNVYGGAAPEIHSEINRMARERFERANSQLDSAERQRRMYDATELRRHVRAATEEYLAGLAERTDFRADSSPYYTWWDQIKRWFVEMLHDIGLPNFFAMGDITDNELRYVLWRSYKNLSEPGHYRNPWREAEDVSMQYRLKTGEFAEPAEVENERSGAVAEDGEVRFMMGDGAETFKERQRRAVEEKGVVMPGLNSAEVKVVDVPRHTYTGRWSEARDAAIEDAVAKYTQIIGEGKGQGKRVPIPQSYDNFGVSFTYNISAKSIKESVNPEQVKKSSEQEAPNGVHLAVLNHLDEVIGESIEVEEHPDYKKDENGERKPENGWNDDVLVHRFVGAITVDGQMYRVKTTMLEYLDKNRENRQYAYDVAKIEVLDESPNTTNGLNEAANGRSSLANILKNVEKSYDSGKLLLDESAKEDRNRERQNTQNGSDDGRAAFMVSEERDADYMDAVEKGDSEEAGRMVREAAKRAMPETKVVDENGEPKVVLHGTPDNSFYEFDDEKIGSNTDAGWLGRGFYFYGNNPEYARQYAGGTGRVLHVYLDIRNPYYATSEDIERLSEANDPEVSRQFREQLEEEGYDGVYYNGDLNEEWVAFHPNQVKSADPVTYDNRGNVIPLSERFNPEKEDIRFMSSGDSEDVFVSNARRAVEGIRQEKASPQQWLAMIQKAGGLKAAEDKWMGLSDWLREQKAKSLTKDEVLRFILGNQVRIEEETYADAGDRIDFKQLQKDYDEWLREEGQDYAWEQLIERFGDDAAIAFDDIGGELTIANGEAAAALLGSESFINDTRLEYTTEGLENKREIALTVPAIEPWNESDEIHFGDAGGGRAVAWIRFGDAVDADGNKVLVIDEIQSKRHQEGRERGYRTPDSPVEKRFAAQRAMDDYRQQMVEKYGQFFLTDDLSAEEQHEYQRLYEEMKAAIDADNETDKSYDLPDAPFEKNWHELALKRMLRYAAENGYDKVAWTKGAQQAERYRLGGVVERIVHYRTDGQNGAGERQIGIHMKNGDKMRLVVDADGKVTSGAGMVAEGTPLSDVVGKELAAKIMNGEGADATMYQNGEDVPAKRIDGDGLRIGGEGMKGFYDQILPRFMDKYGKKWGVRTGEVELAGVRDDDLEAAGGKMWSVDVTDAMKESVMGGQVMFMSESVDDGRTEEIMERAKKKFGLTDDVREAGYVLPDGGMLDFSGRNELDEGADDSFLRGSRQEDHRRINSIAYDYDADGNEVRTGVETDMRDFIRRGGIRIDAGGNVGIINLAVKPTEKQRAALRRLINLKGGNVDVDFGDGWNSDHYVEYDGAKAQRVLGDIDRYFDEGIKPEGNVRFMTELGDQSEEAQRIYNLSDEYGLKGYADTACIRERDEIEQYRRYFPDDFIEGLYEEFDDPHSFGYHSNGVVVVFTGKMPQKEWERIWWHEQTHNVFSKLSKEEQSLYGQAVLNYLKEREPSIYNKIIEHYNEEDWEDEACARFISDYVLKRYDAKTFLESGYGGITEIANFAKLFKEIIKYGRRTGEEHNQLRRYASGERALETDLHRPPQEGRKPVDKEVRPGRSRAGQKGEQSGDRVRFMSDEGGEAEDSEVRDESEGGEAEGSELEGGRTAEEEAAEAVAMEPVEQAEITLKELVLQGLMAAAERYRQSGTMRTAAVSEISAYVASLQNAWRKRKGLNKEALEQTIGAKVRRGMSWQKAEDQALVEQTVRLAKLMLQGNFAKGLTPGEVKRLMGYIQTAVGRPTDAGEGRRNAGTQDPVAAAKSIVDLLALNQLRTMKGMVSKMMQVKTSKVNSQGVEVQAGLDLKGQVVVKAMREALQLSEDDLGAMVGELRDAMGSDDPITAENAALRWQGYMLAVEYNNQVRDSESEEKQLFRELRAAEQVRYPNRKRPVRKDGSVGEVVSDEDAARYRAMTGEQYKEWVESMRDGIRRSRLERMESLQLFMQQLGGRISESVARAQEARDREVERVREIQHNANSDLKGMPALEQRKETWWDKFVNWAPVQFFNRSLANFDMMLRFLGERGSVDGRGYLWNRFMGGWMQARAKEQDGVLNAFATLDKKAQEVFGRKKVGGWTLHWSDIPLLLKKAPTVRVSFWNGDGMVESELSQGNIMYIYMVNKMEDGRMKLRRMGIGEEAMAQIEEQLDPRLKELADWLQGEYLPQLRVKYNEVHERLFGVPMAAIDDYFPLRINKNSLKKEEDVGAPRMGEQKPSTYTGAVIKRKRNTASLDLLGTDAMDVMLDHIQEMEHWAAFAELNRDMNTLLSYGKFRNRVKNMASLRFGSGEKLWSSMQDVFEIAAGVYRPKAGMLDKSIANVAKGVTSAKISLRVFTAEKQLLSYSAFWSNASAIELARAGTHWIDTWKWAMENLPDFRYRWGSRIAGDSRLLESDADWKMWKNAWIKRLQKAGMSANAAVDAFTVSQGAKAVYETAKKRYLKEGYSEERADELAKRDAVVCYNESQQSSENAFLSAMQLDRTASTVAFTVFRNGPMGYQRRFTMALARLKNKLTGKIKKADAIEFMTKQLVRDGLDEDRARKAAESRWERSTWKDLTDVAVFGYICQLLWNAGEYLNYIFFGDDGDDKWEMVRDCAWHAIGGGVEGLTGGNLISDNTYAAIKSWFTGDKANMDWTTLPLASDIKNLSKRFDSDKIVFLNDLFNLGIQMGVGTNPQTLADVFYGVYDAFHGGDFETAQAFKYAMLRIICAPQSQVDKLWIDELGLTKEEGGRMSLDQLARHYANYKMRHNAPWTSWAYGDAREAEIIEKHTKELMKMVDESLEGADDETLKRLLDGGDGDLAAHAAKRMYEDAGLKKGSTKTDYGKRYDALATYEDVLEDVLLKQALQEAGEDSERGKAIKRLQNRIRAIKKGKDTEEEYIPGLANPDGNEEEIMRQIRGVRAQGLRELGIR